MNISIASYSFHRLRKAGMMDVFGYLESTRYRYLIDGIDLWNGMAGTDEQVFDPDYARKVRQAIDERSIIVANYHVDGVHPWEDDPAKRKENREKALKHIAFARAIGARTVRIDAGGRAPSWTAEQFDWIVKCYREYCSLAADFGARLGPENHWGTEYDPANFLKLAKAIDQKAYGVLLHFGRWTEGADTVAADKLFAPLAMHTHLVSNIIHTRLDETMQFMADAGYQGFWSVEEVPADNTYAELDYLVSAVRKALERRRVETI